MEHLRVCDGAVFRADGCFGRSHASHGKRFRVSTLSLLICACRSFSICFTFGCSRLLWIRSVSFLICTEASFQVTHSVHTQARDYPRRIRFSTSRAVVGSLLSCKISTLVATPDSTDLMREGRRFSHTSASCQFLRVVCNARNSSRSVDVDASEVFGLSPQESSFRSPHITFDFGFQRFVVKLAHVHKHSVRRCHHEFCSDLIALEGISRQTSP